AAPAPGADPRAVCFLAYARLNYGNPATGSALATRALAEARANDDRWCAAAALTVLASAALFRGEIDEVERYATQSAALFDELREGWGRLEAAEHLAHHAEITGDYERARRLHSEGARRAEELGLWTHVSYRLTGQGRIALLTGDLPRSRELHERARDLAAKHLDPAGEEYATVGLAMVARRAGRPADAEALLAPWLEWNRRLRTPHGLALILAELGFAAEQRGALDQAAELHLEGLAAAHETADPRAIALALEGLAGVRATAGESAPAAQLLGTATALRAATGAPLPPAERGDVDRITALATQSLGPDTFAAEHRRGTAMRPDEHPGTATAIVTRP
ncbi:AfsR/SARP family transcriptional regulator, partial [Streptomyces sp. A7024]|nr:AfsR/SARP family transcriptional regulator [Streptomyces coryli]